MQTSSVSRLAHDVRTFLGRLLASYPPQGFASVEQAMREALYRHEQARIAHASAAITLDTEEKRLAAISGKRIDLEQRAVAAIAADRRDLAVLAARSIAGLEAEETAQQRAVDDIRRTVSALHGTVEDGRRRLVALKQGYTVAQLRRSDNLSNLGESAIERAETGLAAIASHQRAARFMHEPNEADRAAIVLGDAGFGDKRMDPADIVLARLDAVAHGNRQTALPGIASMPDQAS